jgi:hypothetical protein
VPGTHNGAPAQQTLQNYSFWVFGLLFLPVPASKELRKLSEVFGDGCLADLALSLQY